MKLIPLTQGQFALVDDEDYERISAFKWFAVKSRGTYYARRNQWNSKLKRDFTIPMHRVILNAAPGVEVDHRDNNGLNNQKHNLRNCSDAEQSANKSIAKNNKTGFKGVLWHKRDHVYEAGIRVNRKFIYLGRFDDPEQAAKVYDAAALSHFGEFAKTNQMLRDAR